MKLKAVAAIVAPVIAVSTPFLLPKLTNVRMSLLDTRPAAAIQAADGKDAAEEAFDDSLNIELAELQTAVEQGIVKAGFIGNGRDAIKAKLTNRSKRDIKVQVEAGQMFEAGLNSVVVVRAQLLDLPAGQLTDFTLATAATRSGNKFSEQNYRLTYGRVPKVDALLTYLQDHPEVTNVAVQTAVLALTENLPLSAVAKFPTITSGMKSRFNTDMFRVETVDLISALSALREAGIPDEALVLSVDPQLRIESMIDPACRASAMRYFGISGTTEWEYWRKELLEGDLTTRHYALYGIARFYPDTALEMLPKWAREARTTPVFRLTAVQALAETMRPEALPVLRQLADELGVRTELGRAAVGAAEALQKRLSEHAVKQPAVAFRGSVKEAQN